MKRENFEYKKPNLPLAGPLSEANLNKGVVNNIFITNLNINLNLNINISIPPSPKSTRGNGSRLDSNQS